MANQDNLFDDLIKAGDDIAKSVDSALKAGDFSELSSDITKSVERAKRGIQTGYRQTPPQGNGYQRSPQRRGYQTPPQPRSYQRPQDTYGSARRTPYRNVQNSQKQTFQLTPFVQTEVKQNTGNNRMIGGAIGAVIFGVSAIEGVVELLMYGAQASDISSVIITGAICAICAGTFFKGRSERNLAREFQTYANLMGQRTYIEISELARLSNEPEKTVLDNLKKMMQKGLLPQAMLDESETTLMLTKDVYDAYLQNKESQKIREAEERKKQKEEANLSEEEKNVRSIIEEGNLYIQKIHDANDAIPDDVMSEKLDRLENIMRRIFDQVKKHPETAGNLRKLMDYYLPTIEKLLNAYISLDQQTIEGNNIRQTKKQIEDVLDTVNDAFENLLDSMFDDMAWDISSDISVMQTMLKQDGLAGESITGKK